MSQFAMHIKDNTLSFTGELTYSNAESVLTQSIKAMEDLSELMIDLKQLQTNSVGLALLIELIKHAKLRQKTIFFVNLPSSLSTIAKASGFDIILTSYLRE